MSDLDDNPSRNRSGHQALRRGRWSKPGHVYHITTATHERRPWLADFETGRIVVTAILGQIHATDARLLCWVVMPDHFHALVQLGGRATLSRVINRCKAASANAANRHLKRNGAFWAKAFHDHALRSDEDLNAVARYIIANPLRAGLVEHVGDYPFWDSVWL